MELSKNFNRVKSFYDKKLWSKKQVKDAVVYPVQGPWITEDEYELITGEKYQVGDE